MVALHLVKPLGANFIRIGPLLSSSPQGPYSCKAQPLTIIVHISKGTFSPFFFFFFFLFNLIYVTSLILRPILWSFKTFNSDHFHKEIKIGHVEDKFSFISITQN
jgi:hypothetical protein